MALEDRIRAEGQGSRTCNPCPSPGPETPLLAVLFLYVKSLSFLEHLRGLGIAS